MYRQQVAALRMGELLCDSKYVATFTDWTDYVVGLGRCIVGCCEVSDVMTRSVHGRTNQVVHPCIEDDKFLRFTLFDIKYTRNEVTTLTNDRTSQFEVYLYTLWQA